MSRLLAAVVLLLLQLPGVHLQGLGDVRLAGYGATRLGGRVEFFENGEWKGICNDQFGGEDANVICRQLGLGHATKIINQDRDYILKRFLRSRRDYTYNRFGVGPAVRITDLDCNGNETHILNCPFQLNNDVNRFTYCQLHEVVGVQCDNYLPQPYNGQVNLIGGIYPSEGRLAVFFNGRWGGVCREDFDRTNLLGDTICRQLGYTNVDFARINSSGSDLYGPALERTWLDGLSCSGLESSRPVCLKSCLPTRTAPQPSQEVQCNLGQVGLRCVYGFASRNPSLVGTKKSCEVEVGATPSEGDVRLMNGSLPHLGRLEVYLKGVWGTVCGAKSQVNRRVGDVVCRQLGYTSWDTLHHRSSVAGYGSGSGPRHITKLNCTGLEDSILQCRRENATFSPCSDPDILAVQCSNNTNGVVFGAVTMEGGSGGHGQLYVNTEGYTPLCDHTFGLREANVACRQMGYESAIGMVKNSFYGFGRRPAGVTHIQCHGNETHLLECNYRNDTFERCGDSDQIGLQCSSSNDEREGGLRLVNSPDTNSGLVEMFVEGHWNRLCSNLFSETAADVACRQLGFTGSIEVIKDGRFGSTDSGIFIVHQCHGSEESLFDCDHTPIHPNFCQKDIAISCSRASPEEEGAVRLTGGTEASGRLEVYEYGRWGSVCQKKFNSNEAFVACRQLGFYNYSGFTNSFGRPVREDVTIPINIFSIHCNGTEETLISCDHDVSIRLCNHTLDIILTCADVLVAFEYASYSAVEGREVMINLVATATVPLSYTVEVSVMDLSASNRIDYSIAAAGGGGSVSQGSLNITFSSNQETASLVVVLHSDSVVERNEAFQCSISSIYISEELENVTIAAGKDYTHVTIIDNNRLNLEMSFLSSDGLAISEGQRLYRVGENASMITIRITASLVTSFNYQVELYAEGTASNGSDFVLPRSVLFPANQSQVDVDILIVDDSTAESPVERSTVELRVVPGNPSIRIYPDAASLSIEILDDDSDTSVPRNILVAFERTSYSAVEGREVTINLVATATVPLPYTVEVSVMDLSASNGIDYSLAAAAGGGSVTQGSLNITFSSNQETASLFVLLHSDSVVERNETFRCSISSIYISEELDNVILTASKDYTHVTIVDNSTLNLEMSFLSSNGLAILEEQRLFRVGENASTITIRIASTLVTSFDYQVELYAKGTASNGSDFVLPRSVLFPANQIQVDVDILIVDDTTAESPVERSTVELRVVPGHPSISVSPNAASLSIEILDDDFCQQNLLFPVTQTGRTASVPCGRMVQVDGDSRMIGQMTAKCGMDRVWGPANMSACTFRKGAASGNIVWVVELRGINLTILREEIAQSLDSGMRKRAIAEDAPKVVINLLQEATSSSGHSYSLQFDAQGQLDMIRNSLNNSIISEVTLQRNAGCDCCSIDQVPLTTGARALRICEGTAVSAPLACSCLNGSNACQPRFDYSPNFGCHLDTDRDGVPDVNDTCIGCCVEEVNIFYWPKTDHGSFVEVNCSQLHPSFGNSTVRRSCKTNDIWDPVDLRSCTFTNNTDRSTPILVFNATLDGTSSADVKEKLRQQALDLFSDNATNQTVVVIEVTIINTTNTATPSSPSPQQQVVLFIVQYGQNAELKQGFSAALKSKSSAFVFVEAVIPSDNCECVSNSSHDVRRLCIGTSAPPCGCSSAGTCNVCVDPYTEDDDGSCTLDRDGDEIPDHKDPCPALFGTTCAGPMALPQTSQLCERDTDEEWKLTWRRTSRGKFRTQRCPGGVENSAGLAKRACSGHGKWEKVDVSGCVSRNFLRIGDSNMEVNRALNGTRDSNLPVTVEEVAVAVSVVAMLSTAMRDSAQTNNSILPGDLDIATEVVSDFARLSENNKLFDTVNAMEKTAIVKSVANVFSDVLDSTNNAAFGSTTEQSQAVSLLDSAEQLARSGFTSLSDVNTSTPTNDSLGKQGELVQRNIAIQTNRLNTSLLAGTNFTFPKLSEESLNAFKNSDQVPLVKIPGNFVQAVIQVTANSVNEVNVVSFTLNNIQNHLSGQLVDQEDDKKRSSEVASLVVSSQITEAKRTGIDSVDGPKVQLSFPLLSDVYDKVESALAADERMEVRCAAWNFTGGPEGRGGWSFAGIEVVSSNRTAVECTSTHLTSFCVLVSVLSPEKSAATEAFSVITYIGCSISLVCLLLSIVFFLSLRKELVTRLHNFVHLNLCIALSLGLIVFIAGLGHATEFQGACVFVSVLLHYFFLAAFSWMLCEAVMIYILLVKVFGANERKWIFMYLGLGWGIPVPIVVVSVASRHYEYFITDESGMIFSCWLPVKDGVIAAFIVPMLAILLINAVLLTLSLVSLAKSKCGRSKEVKMEDKENLQTAWQLTKATLILLPLMGFTWIIGLLAVGPGRLGVEIVFILLNSLQGLFIFILHVVRHEKVWSKIKSRLSSIRSEKSTLGSGHSSAAKYTLQRSTLKRSIFSKISTMSSQNTSALKSLSDGVFKPLDNGDDEDTKGSLHDNHEQIEMKEGTNATNGQTTDEPVAVETASSFGHNSDVTGTTCVFVGDAKTDLPVNGEQNQTFSDQAQDPSHKDNDSMQDTKADNGDSPTSL